jgi:hypothetical protein
MYAIYPKDNKVYSFDLLTLVHSFPMQNPSTKLLSVLCLICAGIQAQNAEIETRLTNGELSMNFPSIYFKHNSTDYAAMPYTVDSCFKYMAIHMNDVKSLVIWRDIAEKEQLTHKRIRKLNAGLKKFIPSSNFNIQSMGAAQKISRRTINLAASSKQTQHLLSLNSVFDISTARLSNKSNLKRKICWFCLIRGKSCQVNRMFFLKLRGR